MGSMYVPQIITPSLVYCLRKTNGKQFLTLLTAFKVVGEQSYTHTPEKALKRTREAFCVFSRTYTHTRLIITSSFRRFSRIKAMAQH